MESYKPSLCLGEYVLLSSRVILLEAMSSVCDVSPHLTLWKYLDLISYMRTQSPSNEMNVPPNNTPIVVFYNSRDFASVKLPTAYALLLIVQINQMFITLLNSVSKPGSNSLVVLEPTMSFARCHHVLFVVCSFPSHMRRELSSTLKEPS